MRSCSGCFTLRRAQLEQELLGVEDRLRYIATERAMPADDIVAKKTPALGVVVIAAPSDFGRGPKWALVTVAPFTVPASSCGTITSLTLHGHVLVNVCAALS